MSTPEDKPNSAEAVVVNVVNSEIKHIVPVPADVDADGKPKVSSETVFTGDLLRQIRESQRLSLKELATRTRISVVSLAALENEKFEDLPNARVYVRGFVRCLAVEIGLDRDHVSRTYLPRWEAWYETQHVR
jgi:hypothetical protein